MDCVWTHKLRFMPLSFIVNKRFGRGDDEISFFVKFAADFFDKPKIK